MIELKIQQLPSDLNTLVHSFFENKKRNLIKHINIICFSAQASSVVDVPEVPGYRVSKIAKLVRKIAQKYYNPAKVSPINCTMLSPDHYW